MIDTHCHLDDPRYQDIGGELIRDIERAGIEKIVVPSTNPSSIEAVKFLATLHPFIFPAYGIHPEEGTKIELKYIDEIARFFDGHPVGEIGLDYFNEFCPRAKQADLFEVQLAYAEKFGSPVIVHSRDAFDDTISIMSNFKIKKAVFHCFPYGKEEAKIVLDAGFHISFTGVVTFRKADKVRDTAAFCPIERIMAETDGPYLAPMPFRGKLNMPSYIRYVIEKIADIKCLTFDKADEVLSANAREFFGF